MTPRINLAGTSKAHTPHAHYIRHQFILQKTHNDNLGPSRPATTACHPIADRPCHHQTYATQGTR